MIKERTRLRASGGVAENWAQEAGASIRRSMPFAIARTSLTLKDRERFRRSGQELLALILEACDSESEERLRSGARRIGQRYADWARRCDFPADRLLTVLFRTRHTMVQAALDLADTKGLEPQAVAGILRQVHHCLDAVELALIRGSLPAHPSLVEQGRT